MARDPPHPDLADSELRDLSTSPRSVVHASITTIHPQLRDLIVCPQVAGRVYHVKARGVVEVVLESVGGEGGSGAGYARSREERAKSAMARQVRTVAELPFTPNCLTASTQLLACGGQSGELHLSSLPPYPFRTSTSHTAPEMGWSLTMTLPHSSINNSFLLLPPYAEDILPTRPSTPTPVLRPRYPHAHQSGSTGEGIATFPNTLPAGGGGSLGLGLGDAQDRERERDRGDAESPAGMSYEEVRAWQTLRAGEPGLGSASYRRRSTRLDGIWDHVVEQQQQRDRERARDRDHRDPSHRASASASPFRASVAGIASSPAHVSPYPSPVPTRFAHRSRGAPVSYSPSTASSFSTAADDAAASRLDEPRLLISNNDMSVKVFAIRNSVLPGSVAGSGSAGTLDELWRERARWGDVPKAPARHHKLAKVGSLKLSTAVNHSSVSPDGKTMVVVGDTTDVFLYDVIGGGRDFRRIGQYQGSSDSGFSTSWSKDGRKFAVASQDGQCTVWDHRSSHPLAKMFSSPLQRRSSPSFSSDISALYNYWDTADEEGFYYHAPGSPTGSGTRVRRDPARVVKFSPEGSSRDLLVFTEESNNIHIVDARTFTTQLTLPVPKEAGPPGGEGAAGSTRSNTGASPIKGISGACFDPTGDFLYTGTERTIAEYDLRTTRKRGSGWAGMA